MSRFDYVRYDDQSAKYQENFKHAFGDLEREVEARLMSPRAKALVLTKLEEAYMWVGKAIRDDQVGRTGHAALQEKRSNA